MSTAYGPPGYPPAAPAKKPSPVRAVISTIVFLIAAVLTVPSVLAYWAHTNVDNTEKYVAAIAPLADDPDVQQAVSDQLSDAVVKKLQLSSVFETAVRSLVEQLSGALMKSEAFDKAWVKANTRAQKAIISALEGENSAVTVQGQDVVLDLTGLTDEVKSGLVERGLGIASNLTVPAGSLEVRLFSAQTLKAMQASYKLFNPVAGWLVFAVAGLYLLSLLVARSRGVVLAATGVVVSLSALVIAGLILLGGMAFTRQFSGQPFQVAADAYYNALTASLAQWWPIMLFVGLGLAVLGGIWAFFSHRRTAVA